MLSKPLEHAKQILTWEWDPYDAEIFIGSCLDDMRRLSDRGVSILHFDPYHWGLMRIAMCSNPPGGRVLD